MEPPDYLVARERDVDFGYYISLREADCGRATHFFDFC